MSRFPFCFCSPTIKVSGDGQTDRKDDIHSPVLAPCVTFLSRNRKLYNTKVSALTARKKQGVCFQEILSWSAFAVNIVNSFRMSNLTTQKDDMKIKKRNTARSTVDALKKNLLAFKELPLMSSSWCRNLNFPELSSSMSSKTPYKVRNAI